MQATVKTDCRRRPSPPGSTEAGRSLKVRSGPLAREGAMAREGALATPTCGSAGHVREQPIHAQHTCQPIRESTSLHHAALSFS